MIDRFSMTMKYDAGCGATVSLTVNGVSEQVSLRDGMRRALVDFARGDGWTVDPDHRCRRCRRENGER